MSKTSSLFLPLCVLLASCARSETQTVATKAETPVKADFTAGKKIYVSTSASQGDGSNTKPFSTVKEALAIAKDGVNPDKIGALGGSAGGHLVALLGTTDTRDNSDTTLAKYSSRVQCVVDLFGPTDFVSMIDGTEPATTQQGILVQGFLGPLPENAKNYREASPLTHVDARSAPFLIFHGGKDTLVPVEQSQKLDEALRKAGVESKLVVFPNAGHGYSNPVLLMQTLSGASDFFERHLKK